MAETLVNKTQAGEGIWTSDNLVAGSGINISQVPQPLIDENTICLWHLDDDVNNTIEGGNPFFPSASWTFNNARFGKGLFYSSTRTQQSIGFPNYSNTQNFTLDFWFKLTQSNQYFVFYTYYNASQRLEFYNTYLSLPGSTVSTVTYPSGINVLDWTHFALVNDYSSNKTYYFINGIKFHEASSFYYLQNGALARYGAIDEVRVSNVARWTSNFTPYTVPYSASAGPAQYAINNTKSNELPSQTGNSGKYLTTDGTNASWAAVSGGLSNTATAANSLTINGAANTTSATSVNIGDNSQAIGGQSVAIGAGTTTSNSALSGGSGISIGFAARGNYEWDICIGREAEAKSTRCICIGTEASATANKGLAIGHGAKSQAQEAIQLGTGTNSTAGTVQIKGTRVLDANGKIPAASLDTAIPTVDQTYSASSTNAQSGTAVASAISGKQNISNLVTSVSSASTDSQYPSAKLFYDTCGDIETLINAL